jgi:hypothetical protein
MFPSHLRSNVIPAKAGTQRKKLLSGFPPEFTLNLIGGGNDASTARPTIFPKKSIFPFFTS